ERERQGGAVVNYYSSSSLPYAIKFGTDYSNNFYGPLLDELYPGRLFWNPWMSHFSNFSGPLDADRLRAAAGGDSFVMHGYSFADSDFRAYLPPEPLPDGLRLEDLHRGDTDRPGLLDGEALYRATFAPR
ncbi:MAG TPA: hypothetical protein VEQ42_05325, partial [Pyrinomonadaceae bacterium]|nr:hypothetical protein [Pyrinomonadaceae bacterium]